MVDDDGAAVASMAPWLEDEESGVREDAGGGRRGVEVLVPDARRGCGAGDVRHVSRDDR